MIIKYFYPDNSLNIGALPEIILFQQPLNEVNVKIIQILNILHHG